MSVFMGASFVKKDSPIYAAAPALSMRRPINRPVPRRTRPGYQESPGLLPLPIVESPAVERGADTCSGCIVMITRSAPGGSRSSGGSSPPVPRRNCSRENARSGSSLQGRVTAYLHVIHHRVASTTQKQTRESASILAYLSRLLSVEIRTRRPSQT